MDIYQFIASLVASLSWPVAAVVIAATQRKPITRLLDRVRNAKLFGAELDVGEQIEAVREQIEAGRLEQVSPSPDPDEASVPPMIEDQRVKSVTDALATTSAVGTVIASWAELENALREEFQRRGLSWGGKNTADNFYRLKREGRLPLKTINALLELRAVRNAVAHGKHTSLSLEEANSYRAAVNDFLIQLPHLDFASSRRRTPTDDGVEGVTAS